MPVLPADLLIRPWRAADLPRVCAIEAACFGEPWSEAMFRDELANPVARCLVCVGRPSPAVPSDVLGFALWWRVVDELHLHQIAVDPAWRRRGLARRLMEELERRGAAEGAVLIDLEVRPGNHAARALYRGLGFQEVGLRRRYYADGEDAVVLHRSIGPAPPEAA